MDTQKIQDTAYRRWLEVRFYHWCRELYKIRNNLLDVILAVEAIAQIGGDVDIGKVKNLAGTFISDPYYKSNDEEFILLAHDQGEISYSILADHYEMKKPNMIRKYNRIAAKKDMLIFPRLNMPESIALQKFFDRLEDFKNIGL